MFLSQLETFRRRKSRWFKPLKPYRDIGNSNRTNTNCCNWSNTSLMQVLACSCCLNGNRVANCLCATKKTETLWLEFHFLSSNSLFLSLFDERHFWNAKFSVCRSVKLERPLSRPCDATDKKSVLGSIYKTHEFSND